MTATNETYIEFGGKGLDILSSKIPKIRQGQYEKDVTAVDYAESSKVYSKDECYNKTECYNKQEVYTKEEVDALIAQKIEEAFKNKESDEGDDNGTAS